MWFLHYVFKKTLIVTQMRRAFGRLWASWRFRSQKRIEHVSRPLKGDLSLPKFGLSDGSDPHISSIQFVDSFTAEWEEISAKVTIIYNVAAYVNHYLAYALSYRDQANDASRYADHRAANVTGTLNMLRLTCTGVPKLLVHVWI